MNVGDPITATDEGDTLTYTLAAPTPGPLPSTTPPGS